VIVLQTVAVAVSMFSAVPMPQFEWNEKNMRGALAAFPLVGVLCAALTLLWALLCRAAGFGPVLTGAGLAVAPVLVTGGIHLDGFCDTSDALASHAPREKKLEILKDSHCGAFAVIAVGCYLVFYAALASELALTPRALACLALTYGLTRVLSGLAVASFPCAKNSGLAHTFASLADRRLVRGVLLAELILLAAALMFAGGLGGAAMLLAAGLTFTAYFAMSRRVFGGITGDLAGWFLQLCELLMLFALVLAQKGGFAA